MSKAQEHLERCLDTIRAVKELSDETLIIMFNEYAKLVMKETSHQEISVIKNEDKK